MITKSWEERASGQLSTPEALAHIEGASLLTAWFGKWPTFEDAEVVSLDFDRGNHQKVVQSAAWSQRVPPSLTATFYVFDNLYAAEDSRRRNAEVSIRFEEFSEFEMDGFNYQNPIVGIAFEVRHSESLKASLLLVNWGGTGLHHEVSFLCNRAKVVSVSERSEA